MSHATLSAKRPLRARGHLAAPDGASPALTARELVLLCAGALALALLTSWPLVLHLGSEISPDLGDPVRTAWQIAVEGHQLWSAPLHLFATNAFWPHSDSLTFSDSLLGYAPLGMIGSGATATLVRYNLIFLLTWALAFAGAYLLARELRLRPAAAAVAGAAFAYAPYKQSVSGHLHVLSSGGIPLAMFLLLRGYARRSPATMLAGWLVAAWQLTLGFTNGMPFAYTMLAIALVLAVVWWRRGRPPLPRGLVVACAIGIAVCALAVGFQARPYLQTASRYSSAARPLTLVKQYSAPPKALLAASNYNRMWSGATRSIRDSLSSPNESAFFPGLTIVLLVIAGMGGAALSRRLRWWLLAGSVALALVALGLDLMPGGWPYRAVYHLPGWDGVRVPGRVFTMATLGLALLAGAGAQRLLGALRAPVAIAALLIAAIVVEGAGALPHPRVPPAPPSTAALPQPQLYLPTITATDRLYQYWSTDGWPLIANGVSTFDLRAQDDLRGAMHDFPDAAGIAKLRRLGIRTVVLDPQVTSFRRLPHDRGATLEPPDPAAAARKPVNGLGVTVRRSGPLFIYEIH